MCVTDDIHYKKHTTTSYGKEKVKLREGTSNECSNVEQNYPLTCRDLNFHCVLICSLCRIVKNRFSIFLRIYLKK